MGGSETDGGLFEFDQLSDSSDDGGTDPPDEPDRADPPDDAAGSPTSRDSPESEPSTGERGGADNGERSSPSNEPTNRTEATDSEEGSEGSSGSDTDDPPDTPDDGGGGNGDSKFYEIDPVAESQQAFQFAEKRSLAAAETAYKHAAESWLGQVIKRYTSPEVRKRLDEVFSRRMLGSVLVGGAFTQIITVTVDAVLHDTAWWEILIWVWVFLTSLIIFVWWERLAHRASEAAVQAAETASETAEKASEAASQAAERASEAAAEATAANEPSHGSTSPTAKRWTADVVGAGVSRAEKKRAEREKQAERAAGEEQSAATARAGAHRTAARRRRRSAARTPNKRFAGESGGDVVELTDESREPVYEGGGFKNAGDATTEGSER